MFISHTPVTTCRREWVTALVGGAAALAGGLFGAKGNKVASENSLQATRETNEMNYKIWQEQQQHNLDMYNLQVQDEWKMWNAQNEYNNMVNQRQRLEDAGYNPYLALGGANNTAQGMSVPNMNSSPAPTMQAPDPSAFYNGWNAVGDTLQNVLPTVQALAQIKNVNANTAKTEQDTKKSKADTVGQEWQNAFNKATEDVQAKGLQLVNDQLQADIDFKNAQKSLLVLQAEHQEILNAWLPIDKQIDFMTDSQELVNLYLEGQLTAEQVRNAVATRAVLYSQVKLNESQTSLNYSLSSESQYRAQREKFDFDQAIIMADDVVKICANQAIISTSEANDSAKYYYYRNRIMHYQADYWRNAADREGDANQREWYSLPFDMFNKYATGVGSMLGGLGIGNLLKLK